MTSDKQLYKLEVRAAGIMEEFAHLTIENGYMEQVAKGYHQINAELPKGIYHITLRLNEGVAEQYVTLDSDKVGITVQTPPVVSSVVSENFESTHEYYSNQVRKYATEATCTKQSLPASADGNGSLLLFFRYFDFKSRAVYNKKRHSLGKGFSLLGPDRKPVAQLKAPHIAQDIADGWLAFQAPLAADTYYLRYEGKGANREMPLYVAPNWQTQFFMMFGSEPLFASARISINQPYDFYAFSKNNALVDGVLQKMQNGIYYFPPQELSAFVYEKWYNPMLALLAAYVYFLNPKSTPDPLFKIVTENLPQILGESCPDVQALQIMAAKHYKLPLPTFSVAAPCMLLAGMRAIVQATTQNEEIIADGSIADKIATHLYTDTLWTAYHPDTLDEPVVRLAKIEYRQLKSSIKSGLRDKRNAFTAEVEAYSADAAEPTKVEDWLADSLLYYAGKLNTKLEVNDLAQKLKVTPKTVRNTIAAIAENEAYYAQMHDAGPNYKSNIEKLKQIN
jgi:hypothetical protein